MQVEWDEAKREENLRKHGIDFVGVETLFEGFTATMEDDRLDYGEQRFVTFGVMEGRVLLRSSTPSRATRSRSSR